MSPAREHAFAILRRVEQGGYAADLLHRDTAALSARDAGLAEAIVFGCLRFQAQLDFLIDYYSRRRQSKLDAEVRIALRMGIYQLRYLERIPAHAAVTESVELVKKARKRSAAALVNAVLRKVNRDDVAWPDQATELSVPDWMLARWVQKYGEEAAIGIARAALREPLTSVNPETGRQQDIGAQSIVPLLHLRPGMTVLDLCAAPGNKTAQCLAAGARVVACDRYHRRLVEVPQGAERVVLDATRPLPFGVKFDRILVDVPCSGTGTLDRNPEIKWRLRPDHLPRFAATQRAILRSALECLKQESFVVFSTCSLEHEENEEIACEYFVEKMCTRLPGREPGDGFFAAVIRPR
jgi:16S rRNA (cytosine967-C5)-methyltransferase